MGFGFGLWVLGCHVGTWAWVTGSGCVGTIFLSFRCVDLAVGVWICRF